MVAIYSLGKTWRKRKRKPTSGRAHSAEPGGSTRPSPCLYSDSAFHLSRGRCLTPKKYLSEGSRTLGITESSISSEIWQNLLVLTWIGSILLGYLLVSGSFWNLPEASNLGERWVAQRLKICHPRLSSIFVFMNTPSWGSFLLEVDHDENCEKLP